MIDAVLLVLFQAAAGAPAQAPQQGVVATPTTEKAAEPEMICRFEYDAGSRVRKTKVCRPKGAGQQQDKTALQRELDRQGDVLAPIPGIGN